MQRSCFFAERGLVTEVCGASSSGKTQTLLTTAVMGALEDPSLTVVLVCCTSSQSVVSRLRTLVVSLLKRKVDEALALGEPLERAMPRLAAQLREEMGTDVGTALRTNAEVLMDEEAYLCLHQICVVHAPEADSLLLFLHCLEQHLNDEHPFSQETPTLETAVVVDACAKADAAASALVDAAAVRGSLATCAAHAATAAAAVAVDIHCRAGGVGPLMLLVDGLGSVLSAAQSGQVGHHAGNALVVAAGAALLSLARGHDAAVLVSNLLVADRAAQMPVTRGHDGSGAPSRHDLGVKPALGISWISVPDRRFLLARRGDGGKASSDGLIDVFVLKQRDAVRGLFSPKLRLVVYHVRIPILQSCPQHFQHSIPLTAFC